MARRTQNEENPLIRRARVDSLDIYEVTEEELGQLEKGSPMSLQLNFSIFLLSVAITTLITLLTVQIVSSQLYTIFVVVTVIGLVLGVFLFLLWFSNYRSLTPVAKRIRERMKTDLMPENLNPDDPNAT